MAAVQREVQIDIERTLGSVPPMAGIRQQHTRVDSAVATPAMKEHLGIIEALESRDPARAATAIANHIHDARARVQ